MLPISTNILDQLPGGFETPPAAPTGASGAAKEPGLPFGDLLGQMLGSANTEGRILPQNIQDLFPPNDRPAAQDGAPAGPTVDVSLLATVPMTIAVSGSLASEVSGSLAPETGTMSQEAALAQNRLPFDELSLARFVSAQLNSNNSGASLLSSGTYDLLDAQIAGEQLDLTLVPRDATGDEIKISVPLSVFEEAVLGQEAKGVTLPVGARSTGDKTLSLDELLKSLNLKTLEVREPSSAAPNPVGQNPLELILIGENQGARVTLTAGINKHDLLSKITSDPHADQASSTIESGSVLENQGSSETSSEGKPDDFQMLFKKPLSDAARNLTRNSLSNVEPFSLDSLTAVEGSDKSAARSGSVSDTTVQTSVKLTLPESITRPFASQGQTIMIRIEPEHLGPARLNLTVHDQTLTARVTVDTPTARLAVESSLSQLTDQLSKAGIQVDRIDVVLSDSGTPFQFQDQRHLWSQTRKMRHLKDDNDTVADITMLPVAMPSPWQYLGTQGVNLLA